MGSWRVSEGMLLASHCGSGAELVSWWIMFPGEKKGMSIWKPLNMPVTKTHGSVISEGGL